MMRGVSLKGKDTMVNWKILSHAYCSATDLPDLLRNLSPNVDNDVWSELWSRICHQGTVYTASYPALPFLDEAATTWKPRQRAMPLALAAAIVASEDAPHEKDILLDQYKEIIKHLYQIAIDTLCVPGLPQDDFVYLLQAALGLKGDTFWGNRLEHLNDGEFTGVCTECNQELYLVIGQYGFFATTEEWVNRPETKRAPIQQAEITDLPELGKWLLDSANTGEQRELSQWFPYIFGITQCLSCGATVRVHEAIIEEG